MLPDTLSASEVSQMTSGSQASSGLPDVLPASEVKSLGGQVLQTQENKPKSFLQTQKDRVQNSIFGNPLRNSINQIKGNIKEGSDSLTASSEGKMNPFQAGANIFKNVTSGVLSPLNQTLGKVISPILSPTVDAINNSQTMNKVTDKLSKVNPNVLGTVADLTEGGLNMLSMGIGEGAPEAIKSGVNTVKSGVRDYVSNKIPEKITNDWKKPTEVLNASYNKARDVLSKSPETPKFLAEQKLDSSTHIVDGKYDTEGTAQSLRDTAGQMSKDTLRPSLKVADYSVPKTPVEEIINKTIQNIENSKNVTPGDMENQIIKAKSEGEVLKKKFPNGMNLTDMHDNNITYAKNGGYSPIDTPDTGNIKSVNRAFGRSLGDLVKNKAPKELGVDAFQSYLSKYYKAADYLDTLQNKKAPRSLGSRIAYKTAQLGGAMAGHALGGGILADVAGYGIGGAIEHALENIPNPIRASFLRNLETSNPEAFTKVQAYLKNQGSSKGVPLLGKGSFIAPKAPSEEVQMKGRANSLIPKDEGVIPKTTQHGILSKDNQIAQEPLAQEARKYKSANEFVKAQGKPVYHGSKSADIIEKEGFKKMPIQTGVSAFGKGSYLTTSIGDAKGYGGVVKGYLPKDIKLKKVFDSDAYMVDTQKLIKEGYDGVELDIGGGRKNITIFDPAKIKTKSQLTDFYNKVKGN